MEKQAVKNAQGISNPKNTSKEVIRRLLTIKETAEYLGRSVWSVRELIWKGELPIVRVGKRIHLDIYELDTWVEDHKTRYTF